MGESDLLKDPVLAEVAVFEKYKVLGGVVLYHKLGQGGMAAVYRGHHLRLRVDVAVKVMVPPPGVAGTQRVRSIRRFVREAQTAAAIDHQNLVRVIDVNCERGVYFLVMQFVNGESAADRLRRRGRLPEAEAVEICLAAADGLAEAHSRGIVHRDIKPANIMVDRAGKVKVTDLGLAKAFADHDGASPAAPDPGGLTVSQAFIGTPAYMSPEQTRSAGTVGPQADVWSLGATLYELLTGTLPWPEADLPDLVQKIRSAPLSDPRNHRPELSEGICRIIEKVLRKTPDSRYADCGGMAGALRRHLTRLSPERSLLPDPEAGKLSPTSVRVTPPLQKTMTLIAASILGASGAPKAGRSLGIAEVVEKRIELEERRRRYRAGEMVSVAGALRAADRDIRVAKEIEDRDPEAAMGRLGRAEKTFGELDRLAGLIAECRRVRSEADARLSGSYARGGYANCYVLLAEAEAALRSLSLDEAERLMRRVSGLLRHSRKAAGGRRPAPPLPRAERRRGGRVLLYIVIALAALAIAAALVFYYSGGVRSP